MKATRRKSSVRANPGALKPLLDAHKYKTRLLGDIQEDLLSRHEDDDGRDHTMLHPSEMAKTDWCPRAAYYQITKTPFDSGAKAKRFSWVLENVFNEGHDSHSKWQERVNRLGKLRGLWECNYCGWKWMATSPKDCGQIGCHSGSFTYREVPLRNEEYLITSHADGDIDEGNEDMADDPLMEIKTIGLGTLRFEAPGFLADNTHKVEIDGAQRSVIDYDGLWKSIKRPFPSHLKQGMVYLFLAGRKKMIYIYDCKWNQQVKEFVIGYRPEVVEPLLDAALDVKYALKVERPVDRPHWAEQDCPTCVACPYFETCWSPNGNDQPRPSTDAGLRAGEAEGSSGPAPAAQAPAVRPPGSASPTGRVVRRRVDAPVRGADEMDRLPGRRVRRR